MPILHALASYFGAVLLCGGFLVEMARFSVRRKKAWTVPWAAGLLWAGTAFLMIAAYSGLLPPLGTPSVLAGRAPWESHLFLGAWVTGVFVVLSFWRAFARRTPGAIFPVVWAAGLWVLWAAIAGGRGLK